MAGIGWESIRFYQPHEVIAAHEIGTGYGAANKLGLVEMY